MKKGIVRQNWIHYRKWIVTWAVLIFIFSLISLSVARAGYGANSPENEGMNQGSKILTDKVHTTEEVLEKVWTQR